MAVPQSPGLLRDPRCSVHSTLSNKDATGGEFKLYGRAIDTKDSGLRQRCPKALYEKINWDPASDGSQFHLFSIDSSSVAFAMLNKDETWTRKLWKAG